MPDVELKMHNGRPMIFIDGQPAGMIDMYIVPNTTDMDMWHAYGLPLAEHTLKIVTREDRHENSRSPSA